MSLKDTFAPASAQRFSINGYGTTGMPAKMGTDVNISSDPTLEQNMGGNDYDAFNM